MVSAAQVEIILHPWLGARLSEALFPLMEDMAVLLSGHASLKPPDALAARLDSMIFLALRDVTGGSMLVSPEGEGWVRVRVEDCAVMADELLFPLFATYPVDAAHLTVLRDFSLRQCSLSALRALYTRFAPLQSPQELRAIADVARSCHPAFRLRGWLEA